MYIPHSSMPSTAMPRSPKARGPAFGAVPAAARLEGASYDSREEERKRKMLRV